jgi:hypothetical protein
MPTSKCRPLPKLSPQQIAHFWEKVQKTDGCWYWTGAKLPNGYGAVGLYDTSYYAHRVAWAIYYGDTTKFVLHKCDNPPCVNPAHLFLGTQLDNMHDCTSKGRKTPPPRICKLTEEQVQRIRAIHAEGLFGYRHLGYIFGVDRAVIKKIVKHRIWKHI